MFEKALKYLNNKRPEKAIPLYKKLLEKFEHKEAWLNLGTCYKSVDKFELAVYCTAKALDAKVPFYNGSFVQRYPVALNNMGLLMYMAERDTESVSLYLEAIKLDPYNYSVYWNLAEVTLRMYCSNKYEDLKACWDLYEYRLKREGGIVLKNKKKDLETWNGIDHVASIVVLTEQGFGDMIMFGRYLSQLEKYADKIWIQASPQIAGLFSKYSICTDPIETDATHGIPMCSLGRVFSDGIPSGDWLKDKYVRKLPNATLDIGVAWSGNSDHVNDRNRSTSPGRFLPLSKWGNLYTLNPTEHGTKGFRVLSADTFASTLENLSKLDLVITVDTALAHLCGACGIECWVLMPLNTPDFRWGDSSMGAKNIWYDSVRVIRNPNSWEKVFEEVNSLLRKRCEV
jgi:hypothetical protein